MSNLHSRLRRFWVRISDDVVASVISGLILLAITGAGTWFILHLRSSDEEPQTRQSDSATSGPSTVSTSPSGIAEATSLPTLKPPSPTPPAPLPNADDQTAPPILTGDVLATNRTLSADASNAEGDWLEAAPGDDIAATITLTNDTHEDLSGVLLRARVFSPPSNGDLQAVDFTVQSSETGTASIVDGAMLVLEWPTSDGCGFREEEGFGAINLSNMTQITEAGLIPIPAMSSYSSRDVENVNTVAQYALPDIPANASMTLESSVVVLPLNNPPQINGGPNVSFKIASAEEYSLSGEVEVGDVVRVLVRLHNGSCTQQPANVSVRAMLKPPQRRNRPVALTAVTRGSDGWVYPTRTKFGPAHILVTGGSNARLQPMRGTTLLYGGACGEPEELETLPDTLFSSNGVFVSVPGYIPRMECEEHARWITSDLLVVED